MKTTPGKTSASVRWGRFLGLFLLSSPLFAQNTDAVTSNLGDESLGTLGWAVTDLNNLVGAGTITVDGSVGPITLSLPLPAVSNNVLFQGPTIGVVGEDDAQAQLNFQQSFGVDSGTTFSFSNDGNLGSGLDTALTAGSLNLAAGSSFQQSGGTGGNGAFAGGDGGAVAVSIGNLLFSSGAQGAFDGGQGGIGLSVGGAGGNVVFSAGSMGVSGMGTTLSLLGGAGGTETASGPGPALTGNGGSVTLTASFLAADAQAQVAVAGGNSGNGPLSLVVNGGSGGGVYALLGGLSLTAGGSMSVSGGMGAAGSSSSGAGGSVFVTVGSITQGTGSSLDLAGGTGGGNQSGGAVNLLEGSQTLSSGATFTVTGGNGGSGAVTGGNGGLVSVQAQALTLASGSLWQAFGAAGGVGTSVDGSGGSLSVFVQDLEGAGTVSMSGTNSPGLVLANGNFSGDIQGNEGLSVVSYGTVTLLGDNTYGGDTVLSTGTLAVSLDSNLGTGNITLDNGALNILAPSSGATFSTSKAISLTSNGGTLAANFSTVPGGNDFDGVISGPGGLGINGGGFITLNAINTYTGPTTVLNGGLFVGDASHPAAQIAGPVSVSPGGVLLGNGSILGPVTNDGVVSPGDFYNSGTLTVGSYQQTAGAYLLIDSAPSQASLLAVNGAATLDGSVAVSQTSNSFNGVSYRYVILVADSLTGTFATTNDIFLPTNWAATLDYSSNSVTLVLYRANADFTTWATGANQMAVAQALNEAVTSGNDGLAAKLNELYELPSGQGTALGQITGDLYTAVPGILLDNLQFEDSLLFDRLEGGTGAGMPGAQAAVAGGILAAEVQGPAANAAGLANPAVRGLWLENTDSAGSVNSDSNVEGFSKSNFGFLAGYDTEISKGFIGGVMGGFTHTDVTSSDASAKAGVDAIQFGVYGSKKLGALEIGLAAAYGVDHFKDNRAVSIGTDVTQVAGTDDGSQIQAALQGGYPINISGFMVKPLAGLQYAHLSVNGFTETGSDSLALGVPAQGYDSWRPYLGIEGNRYFTLDQDLGVIPRLNLSVSQELDNAAVGYQTTLNGAPGSPFAVTGIAPSSTMVGLEAGLKLVFGKQFNLFANYQGHFSGTQNLNTFNGGLDLAF